MSGKITINGARGFNPFISDRLDLTLECIRHFYIGESSPLSDTFDRYSNFFNLFLNFKEYIDFFLLQDMVSSDYSKVKIARPFTNFLSSPRPQTLEEYLAYAKLTSELVALRNQRIHARQRQNLQPAVS